MGKDQRIRDFIHGLIVFSASDPTDQIAWNLIGTPEFQRLRRIRQLGFSEFVFPGATHSRFSHSLGVYHTARILLKVIQRKTDTFDQNLATTAALAALLHDIGHGPFSHTFDGVEKARGTHRKHELRGADIILGDTGINKVLRKADSRLPTAVAQVLVQEDPTNIYDAVVSSQFDADRLDYLRRDRYVTGTGLGQFDFDWLLDCLEVGTITTLPPGETDYSNTISFYLNHKGLEAAEEYLLARYHLYTQVYLHKTTRAAESMLASLLCIAADKIRSDDRASCPIPDSHPLFIFYKEGKANASDTALFLKLDDYSIWSALEYMTGGTDPMIAELSERLLNRSLYKCFDVGALAAKRGGSSLPRFRLALNERGEAPVVQRALMDTVPVSCYVFYEYEDQGALQKVHIGDMDGAEKEDIARMSPVVEAIKERRITRYYVPDRAGVAELRKIWEETRT